MMGGRSKLSPERLVKPFSRIPKNGGTLPKMRTFLGKVKEMFVKARRSSIADSKIENVPIQLEYKQW
jgi:hypothetical protein